MKTTAAKLINSKDNTIQTSNPSLFFVNILHTTKCFLQAAFDLHTTKLKFKVQTKIKFIQKYLQ
jgi:hypothetical protein